MGVMTFNIEYMQHTTYYDRVKNKGEPSVLKHTGVKSLLVLCTLAWNKHITAASMLILPTELLLQYSCDSFRDQSFSTTKPQQ